MIPSPCSRRHSEALKRLFRSTALHKSAVGAPASVKLARVSRRYSTNRGRTFVGTAHVVNGTNLEALHPDDDNYLFRATVAAASFRRR